jgi:NitT/TauT family transport system substrate-binding protein
MRRSIPPFFASALAAVSVLAAVAAFPSGSDARDLVLAEPVHYVGFLPVYVALKKGFFKDEGIDLQISTMQGAAMIAAVVSGQAFALTASVDRNAEAKAQGKVVKAVVDVDARANIYLMARKDLLPMTGDLASFVRGKRIAVTAFGGTPNSMLRYLLKQWKLEPGKDVTLIEVSAQSVVPITIASKQADLGISAEPFITQGIVKGIWGEPIYAAKDLGPYADTALSVEESIILKEPQLVRGFVKAVMRGLIYTNAHPDEMVAFAQTEMPTASKEDLEASLKRTFADHIYSTNGFIPPEAWTLGEAVIQQAGILKQEASYDDVIDMQFVKDVQKELKLN